MSSLFGPPPAGGDESRATALLASVWTLSAISAIFFLCRLYSRKVFLRNIGWDDGVIGLAVLCNLVACAITQIATHYGLGRHAYYLTLPELSESLKYILILQVFGIMASTLPKLGVAILIINIVGSSLRGRWFLYCTSISLLVFASVNCIILFAECSPPRGFWDFTVPHTCWNPSILTNYSLFVGSYSGTLDLTYAIFPITLFWNLKMELKRKIILCVLMGLGVIASICAFVKTSKLPSLNAHSDFTWVPVSLLVWAGVEINAIIICACVPTLRPLVFSLFGKHWDSRIKPSYNPSGYGGGSSRATADDIALVTKKSERMLVSQSSRGAHEQYTQFDGK